MRSAYEMSSCFRFTGANRSTAAAKPAFPPWASSSSNRIVPPPDPPVLEMRSYVPDECHANRTIVGPKSGSLRMSFSTSLLNDAKDASAPPPADGVPVSASQGHADADLAARIVGADITSVTNPRLDVLTVSPPRSASSFAFARMRILRRPVVIIGVDSRPRRRALPSRVAFIARNIVIAFIVVVIASESPRSSFRRVVKFRNDPKEKLFFEPSLPHIMSPSAPSTSRSGARGVSVGVGRHASPRADSLARASSIERVYACSDLHLEHETNAGWLRNLSKRDARDAVVVAGDVSDDIVLLEDALRRLREDVGFGEVFYTFGNHEVWLNGVDAKRGVEDSAAKIDEIFEMCRRIGVKTSPERVGDGLWIAPIHSYHHRAFDTEPLVEEDVPGVERVMNDFRFAKWPDGMDDRTNDVAEYCDALNDVNGAWERFLSEIEQNPGDACVSFSHFVPNIKLIPEKRMLFYPNLSQASGSLYLEARVNAIKSRVESRDDGEVRLAHVFGHTHFGWHAELDGIYFVQCALATPREWIKRPRSLEIGDFTNDSNEPLCVYSDGAFVDSHTAMWSDYYRSNPRTPEDVELMPHAREFVRRRWGGDRRREKSSAPLPGATGKIK